MRRLLLIAGVLATCALGVVGGHAQPYPSRPVTIIVPFPAGGSTDTVARIMAEGMQPILGQPFQKSLDPFLLETLLGAFLGGIHGLRCKQICDGHVQCRRNSLQQHHGDISFTAFELCQMPFRHVGFLRHLLAGHTQAASQFADALAQEGQEVAVR